MISNLFIIGVAYLVGAIPTGYLLAKWYGIQDIRNHGSGNIGATNVARVLGKEFFVVVLFLDFMKAYGFLQLIQNCVTPNYLAVSAAALFLGNIYSIFLNFTGGKGAATAFGIVAALNPCVIVYVVLVWLVVLAFTKTVGIATVAGFIALPLSTFLMGYAIECSMLMTFIAMLGIWRHRSNLKNYFCSLSA